MHKEPAVGGEKEAEGDNRDRVRVSYDEIMACCPSESGPFCI